MEYEDLNDQEKRIIDNFSSMSEEEQAAALELFHLITTFPDDEKPKTNEERESLFNSIIERNRASGLPPHELIQRATNLRRQIN